MKIKLLLTTLLLFCLTALNAAPFKNVEKRFPTDIKKHFHQNMKKGLLNILCKVIDSGIKAYLNIYFYKHLV